MSIIDNDMVTSEEIIKYLKDEMSENEKIQFCKRLDDPKSKALFIEHKNLWVKTGAHPVLTREERVSDFNTIWNRVTKNTNRHFMYNAMRYAAVIAIVFMLGGLLGYFTNDLVQKTSDKTSLFTFSSGDMSMSVVELPDGSTVKLNSDSRLVFRHDETTNERLLSLDGEAYFDVVHDENSPFIVDFGDCRIVDIGTIFNIKAYPHSDVIETSLIEGAVDIVVHGDVTSLIPGQRASFSKADQKVSVSQFSSKGELAWIRNRFVFEQVSMREIMTTLGEWYGVTVTWENTRVANEKLHLNLSRAASMESIMDLLKMSIDFDCEFKYENRQLKQVIMK